MSRADQLPSFRPLTGRDWASLDHVPPLLADSGDMSKSDWSSRSFLQCKLTSALEIIKGKKGKTRWMLIAGLYRRLNDVSLLHDQKMRQRRTLNKPFCGRYWHIVVDSTVGTSATMSSSGFIDLYVWLKALYF